VRGVLTMKRSFRRRGGYSLPEVLVSVALLGVIGGALTKLVVSQMRFFDSVSAARSARSVARNSMNVVLSDLRMVQDSGGITAVGSGGSSVTVSVPYRFGVYCATAGAISTVSMLPTDSATLAMSVYAGHAWRSRLTGRYTTIPSTIAPITSATPTACTGLITSQGPIKTVTIAGRVGQVLDITPAIPAITSGSPVFFYQTITYSFQASSMFPGKIGLWRTVAGGVNEELMGPFASSARFRFYVSGGDTSLVVTPDLWRIRGLDLVLTASSAHTPQGQTAPSESKMVTSVFFKNVRAH
jgi:prepilin-type N-terminal cleavage/methylation domain-containing protein